MTVCKHSYLALAVLITKCLVHQLLIIPFLLDSFQPQKCSPHFAPQGLHTAKVQAVLSVTCKSMWFKVRTIGIPAWTSERSWCCQSFSSLLAPLSPGAQPWQACSSCCSGAPFSCLNRQQALWQVYTARHGRSSCCFYVFLLVRRGFLVHSLKVSQKCIPSF